jgi:hypothetical protein
VDFNQLGIAASAVEQITINHPDVKIAELSQSGSEAVPGESVLVAGPNTIILEICNTYFEARREDFIIVLVLVIVPVLEGYGGTRNVLRLLINSKKYAPSSFNCSCKKAPSRGRGRRRVRERYRTALRLASPPSAEQIDRSAQLQQRIIRWLNPVYSRNRIKDDFFLFRGVIFDRRGENHLAQPG